MAVRSALRHPFRSTTDARRVRLRLAATGLDLARVLRLAPGSPVRDLRGLMDVRTKYDEVGPTTHVARRAAGRLDVHDLALGAPGLEAVWIRDLAIGRFDLDLDHGQSHPVARLHAGSV